MTTNTANAVTNAGSQTQFGNPNNINNASNAKAHDTFEELSLATVTKDTIAAPHEKKTGGMTKPYRKVELVLPDGRRAWLTIEVEVAVKKVAATTIGPKVRRVALASSSPSPSAPVAAPVPAVDMLAKMAQAMEALAAKVAAMEVGAVKK